MILSGKSETVQADERKRGERISLVLLNLTQMLSSPMFDEQRGVGQYGCFVLA